MYVIRGKERGWTLTTNDGRGEIEIIFDTVEDARRHMDIRIMTSFLPDDATIGMVDKEKNLIKWL